MKLQIMTLFPEMIENCLHTSIIGKAVERGILELNTVNIRDYTQERHGKVDDYTYGGGAGMLLQAQPVYDAYQAVTGSGTGRPRTIYVTPQGRNFDQRMAQELAAEEELIFLCGHYEGIDERVLEEIVTDYVSIGDYVLTGGELAAMVMADAIARLVPGVLGNETSAETESFHNDLLEYPQYSRPEVWRGKKVPEVLLSGNHKNIMDWRLEQAVLRTRERRPDLYARYVQKQALIKRLATRKRKYIHMMELLSRGNGEILYERGGNVLLRVSGQPTCMITAESKQEARELLAGRMEGIEQAVSVDECVNQVLTEEYNMRICCKCYQACYTQREALAVKHKDIRLLDEASLEYVAEHYPMAGRKYLTDRLRKKMMFGAFEGDKLVGFIGIHDEGSMGMQYVEEDYRRRGIASSLEAYLINVMKNRGETPFCQIIDGNRQGMLLQEKLGLYVSKDPMWWLEA